MNDAAGAADSTQERPTSEALAALAAIAIAVAIGGLMQLAISRDRAVAAILGASMAVLYGVVVEQLSARWRRALVGHEAFATVLGVLAAIGIAGTLVVQGQPAPFYGATYGRLAAPLLALGLDDAFHSLWFAGIAGVFCGSILLSAAQRWPPSARTAGFHMAHLGLLVALGGGATSAALAVRGRIDLRSGESASEVRVLDSAGRPRAVPLGFDLRLDHFEVEHYAAGAGGGALPAEVKAFRSSVSVLDGPDRARRTIEVNSPLRHAGWSFYQVGYDPRDPRYSGLEAVHDPGAAWVFFGFALVTAGVAHALYVQLRRRRRSPRPIAGLAGSLSPVAPREQA